MKREEGITQKELLVEATLFLAGRPVSVEEIAKITGINEKEIKIYIENLKRFYSDRSIDIKHLGNGIYEMKLKKDYLDKVDKIIYEKEFSPGVLKTLAFISFKSPVKQSEVVEFRGKKAYEHINELIEKGFIKSEKVGNTKILRITKKLLKYFNLKSEKQLKEYFERLKVEDNA